MDVKNKIISVVLPCLNEEAGLRTCIEKIKEVFLRENINGEIIVVDNGSTDKSAEIAREMGVKILLQPIRGYGAAYIMGLDSVNGEYIIIADADDTYDFLGIPKFINALFEGYDFVIGNRFRGKIHRKAMPVLNRYIGNPILSGLCRLFFRVKVSDIHCGMRAFTKEAYEKMKLKCLGMEFATEMVMEAFLKKLKIKEIPIDYYSRKGISKLEPLKDGWRHLRFMLLFSPDWLYFFPGLLTTVFGLSVLLLLLRGPLFFLGHNWDIHMMVLGALLSILGYQLVSLGMYAKVFALREEYIGKDKAISFFFKFFNLETTISFGLIFFTIGLGANILIFIEWWNKSFGTLYRIREVILAMTFMILGLQIIFSSFFISLLMLPRKKA